jgi:hypothetical protein
MPDNPFVRLIALAIVGGVAKALFAPGWESQSPYLQSVVSTGEQLAKRAIKD